MTYCGHPHYEHTSLGCCYRGCQCHRGEDDFITEICEDPDLPLPPPPRGKGGVVTGINYLVQASWHHGIHELGRQESMSDVRDSERDQPLPSPTDGPSIHELVVEDMLERMHHGTRKYGTPLQAFNGRDPLLDLYQELLDATVYVKQELLEREERVKLARQGGTLTHRTYHNESHVEEVDLPLRRRPTLDLE